MSLQGSLSIERMCRLVAVSRRSFYRSLKEQQPVEEEMEVRSAIQQIALEHGRQVRLQLRVLQSGEFGAIPPDETAQRPQAASIV